MALSTQLLLSLRREKKKKRTKSANVSESNWSQRQALGMSSYLVLEHPGLTEDLRDPNRVVLIPNPSEFIVDGTALENYSR